MTKFAALLALVAAAPAHAADPVVNVAVSAQWTDTGVDLHAGDFLSVTVYGQRVTTTALAGRIGTITFVTSSNSVAPATGRLFLRTNPLVSALAVAPATVRARISYASRAPPTGIVTTPTPVESAFLPLPNEVGTRFPEAVRSLRSFGLAFLPQKRSSSYPAGEVVDQFPAAGTNTHTIRIVILGVSDGSLAPATTQPPPPTTQPPVATTQPPPTAPATTPPPPATTQPPPTATPQQTVASPSPTPPPATPPSSPPVANGAGENGSRRIWIFWLVAVPGALSAALLGFSMNNRMRLAKATRSLLTVDPSVELHGPTTFAGDVTMAGPTTHIQATLEMGDASFESDAPIIEREKEND